MLPDDEQDPVVAIAEQFRYRKLRPVQNNIGQYDQYGHLSGHRILISIGGAPDKEGFRWYMNPNRGQSATDLEAYLKLVHKK